MNRILAFCLFLMITMLGFTSCNEENSTKDFTDKNNSEVLYDEYSSGEFKEGKDYVLFERVRILDQKGFTEPQEAYSLLLPKGWKYHENIIWNAPGSSCAGTFKELKAKSSDGEYELQLFPDIIYSWNSNPEVMRFYQNKDESFCFTREPFDAEYYLKMIFRKEIGNPEITEIKSNNQVVEQMQQMNEQSMNELRQYGAGQMQFHQTAVNADVKWEDGSAGWVTLGVTILETIIPNQYNGSFDKIYTTQVTNRVVFKYPAEEKELAKNQFSFVMASFRSNPSWNESVNKFWKDVRQQKHVAHVGRIRMIDEQTRQIGENAIRNGEARLKSMDMEMRNWEQKQASQDRMHTNFIKAIREVENYKDPSGKYELASGYDHAWSRSDGQNFIMTNNPNFNPGTIFKDQQWKEMKRVD